MKKSRLAILVFGFFFFHAGLAGAYFRCLEAWQSSGNHSEVVTAGIQNLNSEDTMLHCPEERDPYGLNQARQAVKKDPRTKRIKAKTFQVLSSVVIGHTTLAGYRAQPFGAPLLSPFPYPSVAVYQSKVVYRI